MTKTEIALCKKMAKKHEKLIEYGTYLFDVHKDFGFIYTDTYFQRLNIAKAPLDYIVIWSLQDCLDWLRKKRWITDLYFKWLYPEDSNSNESIYIARIWWGETWKTEYKEFEGKTYLEACLRAVLQVLEMPETSKGVEE